VQLDEPMAEALRGALDARARKLNKHLRRAAEGDATAVHDARTAIRRLREGLLVMGQTVFDPERVGRLGDGLHDLEKTLGPTRDDDVLLESVRQWRRGAPRAIRAGIEALEKRVAKTRKRHARALAKDLQRKRVRRAARRVRRFMRGRLRAAVAPPGNPAHAVPALVRHFVADETWLAYEQVLAYDTRVPTADFDVIHKVRSACRRLRYRLEVFEGAVPSGTADVVESLRALQDRLGELHDHVVAVETLEGWVADGRLAWNEAVDSFLQERRQARDRLRAEFDREWRSLTGSAFRRAVAHVASCEMRTPPDGAVRLVPP
jgi:CHAD domain-containing protein